MGVVGDYRTQWAIVAAIDLYVKTSLYYSAQEACDISTFPSNFKFGAASSAYQVEGDYNEDGKGLSWWDWFTNTYPQYSNNSTGNVASDSYHLYKEDVAAAEQIGLDHYRFSISWSRILPKGLKYKINQAGVDYYNNLLDELVAAGIEPMVTLYHWDTPLAMEYLGNTWTGSSMVDYFVDYADLAFSLFGDKVKIWATVNEPKHFCQVNPDSLVSLFKEYPVGISEYLCAHHVLLAHAKTYRLYEAKYKLDQKGRVGIVLDLSQNIPLTNSTSDQEAAERRNQFGYGWFAHPLVHGDYPQIMIDVIAKNSASQNFTYSRLPEFTSVEKRMIKGAYDMFMLNSYTAYYATLAPYNNALSYLNDEQIISSQSPDWLPTAVPTIKYGWFAHPLVHGDYPQIMIDVIAKNSASQNFTYSRLPEFTSVEKRMIKGAYDMFMLNSYTAYYATLAPYNNALSYLNDEQIISSQSPDWLPTAVPTIKVYPEGIRHVLKYIKDNYKNPEIFITENGYSDTTGTLNDTERISFIQKTLAEVHLAMRKDGVNVTRYTYWSLLDSFEWNSGYRPKFGLVHVDFNSEKRTRTLKNSAYYYQNLIRTHNLS